MDIKVEIWIWSPIQGVTTWRQIWWYDPFWSYWNSNENGYDIREYVKTSFLPINLALEVYIEHPTNSNKWATCRLKKNHYFLKQTCWLWYLKIDSIMKDSSANKNPYPYGKWYFDDSIIRLIVNMDEMLIIGKLNDGI